MIPSSSTKLPVDIHIMIGKWKGLHWYCITCEPIVRTSCASKHVDDKDYSSPSTDTRGKDHEKLMTTLECKMEDIIATNEVVVRSYAQTVKGVQST